MVETGMLEMEQAIDKLQLKRVNLVRMALQAEKKQLVTQLVLLH